MYGEEHISGGTSDDFLEISQIYGGDFIVAGSSTSFGASEDGILLKLNYDALYPGCSYFTTPTTSMQAPAVVVSAPALTVTAPALAATAAALTITTLSLIANTICP